MKEIYRAQANSPATTLAADITASDTEITVISASVLPEAPNIAVIGTSDAAETIRYGGKSGNTLTDVTRGFEGEALAWSAGTIMARNFTAYDYNALAENLSNFGTSIITEITITAAGWAQQESEASGSDDYGWYIDVQVAEATTEQFPVVALHESALKIAKNASLCPTAQALGGILRFWAKNVPATDMDATVALLTKNVNGNSGSGGESYVLPAATAETLGGVKIGDGISVTEDGTISLNEDSLLDDEAVATDSDTEEMLDNVFGHHKAEESET